MSCKLVAWATYSLEYCLLKRNYTVKCLAMQIHFPKNLIVHNMHPHAYHTHIQNLSQIYGV